MGDDREKELLFTARPPPGPEGSDDVYNASTVATQAPADLLDLVRAAEDDAKLGAGGGKMPTSATKFHVGKALVSKEEFIDVGEEAIDAPPSMPPHRAATPAKTFTPARHFAPTAAALSAPSEPEPEPESSRPSRITAAPPRPSEERHAPAPRANAPTMPPIAGIVLVFALSIAAIALLTR